ncbi:MAG: hypothetical protein JO112_21675, partial [Planctomycetes bacterium]|nr:hypothetical protein [Planctomycetota bacterium]
LSHESYVAAQAFPGKYEVTVKRLWGRPLGARATLKIIQHQGTPEERLTQETLVFDQGTPTQTITLDTGRRSSAADVPPAWAYERPKSETEQLASSDRILTKLRSLVDPEITAEGSSGIRGAVAGPGIPVDTSADAKLPDPAPGDQVAFQAKVSPFMTQTMDYTVQGVVTADRKHLRLSLSPVFQTLNVGSRPVITNPVIPGGI